MATGAANRPDGGTRPRAGRVVGLGIAALLAAVPAARASVTIEGVSFAPTVRAWDTKLDLSCVGLLRYRVVFKGYVAALYVDGSQKPDDITADVPKRLEISYFWNIAGKDIGAAGEKVLAENVDPETLARLRDRLDRIRALYADVEPGDRYALTYVPGRGTELTLNGKSLGVIEGPDFAAAYFSIWFGSKPIDASLKQQLLGCS